MDKLDEHILSAAVNDKHDFDLNGWRPSIKVGAYGEYRTREYKTREFIYNWEPETTLCLRTSAKRFTYTAEQQ